MAERKWKAKAKDVKQVDTITIALTWATGDTITVTCDGIDFVVTIGSLVTTAQVATTLYEAFNGASAFTDTTASCSPTLAQGGAQAMGQFRAAAATVSGSVVSLTGITAGRPFTFTSTENTVGTGTAALVNATVATGKNWGNNADNWTGDTVPVDTDDIIFDSGNVPCKYGLLLAIQPGSFTKTKGYSGTIGLPEINLDDSSYPYNEYLTKSITFDDNAAATCTYNLEQADGTGSGLVRIDAGAGASIFNVYGLGPRSLSQYPSILLLGTNAANVLNMMQGDVGVGFFGEASTLVAIRAGNGTASGAKLYCGTAVTLTSSTIDISGATVTLNTATATSDIDVHSSGTLNIEGTGAHADIDVQNGTVNYSSSGTLSTLAIRSAGKFNKSDLRTSIITNAVQVYKGSTFNDPNKSLTLSAGFKTNGCMLADVTINLGTDRTYTVA